MRRIRNGFVLYYNRFSAYRFVLTYNNDNNDTNDDNNDNNNNYINHPIHQQHTSWNKAQDKVNSIVELGLSFRTSTPPVGGLGGLLAEGGGRYTIHGDFAGEILAKEHFLVREGALNANVSLMSNNGKIFFIYFSIYLQGVCGCVVSILILILIVFLVIHPFIYLYYYLFIIIIFFFRRR